MTTKILILTKFLFVFFLCIVRRDQRKFLVAAHKEIHKDSEGVIAMYPRAPKTAPSETGTPQ